MSSLTAVVFSKDRPLQLDAMLKSLALNCRDVDLAEIHVLYKSSAPRFAAAYRTLASEHQSVSFWPETAFKNDVLRLLKTGADYVLFLVDDTLFVGEVSLRKAIDHLHAKPQCLGFSFRLGRNTTYCYTQDKRQRLPTFEEVDSRTLAYNWTTAEFDFGYPIELSSSVYRTADLMPLLDGLDYANPNTLEGALARETSRFQTTRPLLACYSQSVALSIPANLVQTVNDNRVDDNPDLGAEALLNRYMRGDRLEVALYQGLVSTACHQEMEFAYRRKPDIPTVSVVIPCYQQAQYLTDAVESVVAQSFADWEVIIVDDGSPDETAETATRLIERHPDRQIRLLRQPNGGLSRARNAGVAAARGRYVLPLDADDRIEPTMLSATVGLLEGRADVAIAYTDERTFGTEESVIRTVEFAPFVLPAVNEFCYCSLYRREVWEAVGGYNPNLIHGYEDWDFWIGAVEHGYRAVRVPQALFLYRVREGSMYKRALEHDDVLQKRIRANHPRLYRPWLRAARAGLLLVWRVQDPIRTALGRVRSPATDGRARPPR